MAHSPDLIVNIIKNIEVHFPKDGINFNQIIQDFEEMLITKALVATKGNYTQAAKLVGLKRTCFAAKVLKTSYKRPTKVEF